MSNLHGITLTPALKQIGITKHEFVKLEKSYQERFGQGLPIPIDQRGYRVFDEHWIRWVRAVAEQRRRDVSWLETLYACHPLQPKIEPQRYEKQHAPSLAAAAYGPEY